MGAIEDAKKAFAAIRPQNSPKNAIELIVRGGEIEMTIISVIEDLLSDYEYFIGMAIEAKSKLDEKRYLRASCLALNAYIEGALNSLYEIHLVNIGKSPNEIGKLLKLKAFHQKCGELEKSYLSTNSNIQISVQNRLRNLRNNLLHFKGDNLFIWDALTLDEIKKQKQTFESWITDLHKSMDVVKYSSEDEISFIGLLMGAFGVMTSRE